MRGWRKGTTWSATGSPAPEGAEWLETVRLSSVGTRPFHRSCFDRKLWVVMEQPSQVEDFRHPGVQHDNRRVAVFANIDTREFVYVDGQDWDVFVPCEVP